MAKSVKTQALHVAASMLGSPRKLRDFLQAPSVEVIAWLSGTEEPPHEVFLRVLDLILDELDLQEKKLGKATVEKAENAEIYKLPSDPEQPG